jgi:hypothetical protein
MIKNKIKKIAEKSFKNKKLDDKIVIEMAKRFKRSELKEYLRELYAMENKNTVKVFLPSDDEENIKQVYSTLRKMYKDKKIVVEIDPSLLVGIRVENEDNIYELSLKNIFTDFVSFVEHKHD